MGTVAHEVVDAETLAAWLRSRPAAVQAVAKKFPPMCYVEGRIPLGIPAPGRRGQLVSYMERNNGDISVTVAHVDDPTGPRADCDLGWLRVVACYGIVTPAWVRKALSGSTRDGQ